MMPNTRKMNDKSSTKMKHRIQQHSESMTTTMTKLMLMTMLFFNQSKHLDRHRERSKKRSSCSHRSKRQDVSFQWSASEFKRTTTTNVPHVLEVGVRSVEQVEEGQVTEIPTVAHQHHKTEGHKLNHQSSA